MKSKNGEKPSRPVPINRKIISPHAVQNSLAAKVGATASRQQKPKAPPEQAKSAPKQNKGLIFPETYRESEPEKAPASERLVVPVNRKVVKESKIKHLQRKKVEAQPPTPKAIPVNRKVVKESKIKHLQRQKAEDQAPPPKAMPINRKVIKERTSDVFLNSEPRRDVVETLKLDKGEKPLEGKWSDQGEGAKNTPGNGLHMVPVEGGSGSKDIGAPSLQQKKKSSEELQMVPVEGGIVSKDIGTSTPLQKKPGSEEQQMVPIEAGRAYQDNKIASKEGTHRQRDTAGSVKNAASHKEQPNMVPIEAGHRSQPQSISPIKGRSRLENALVREEKKAPRKSPELSSTEPQKTQQASALPRFVKPEKAVGNFIQDLKSEATRQEFSLKVQSRKAMKVEFATHSKALSVAFQKQALPFDRIIVKQSVPEDQERRSHQTRVKEKPGLLLKVKSMFGFKKMKERKGDRRQTNFHHLIGELCEDHERVVDWQISTTLPKVNNVAVAAHYKIEGERNFWTVQLVQDQEVEHPLPEALPKLSEGRIKSSLLVLLDGLGDAIQGEMVRAS